MNLLFKSEKKNVFVSMLSLLDVKYTSKFSNKYFNEHPNKNNLLGISQMLNTYGIKNEGIKIHDKEENIFNLETPFIAHTGSDFVPVYKISSEKISYISRNGRVSITPTEFCNFWTGITLFVEPDKSSIEPDYVEHRKKEYLLQSINSLLKFFLFCFLAMFYFSIYRYGDIKHFVLLFANLVGVYISYQLLLKQMNIHSFYGDKICSLFKQKDCNNILESKAAKLFSVISWSEIGISYFISNVIIIIFLPNFITYSSVLNIFTLPYAFWSIWYQKFKAKQWCVLCIIVQLVLWSIFVINILSGFFNMLEIIEFNDVLILSCIYLIPLLAINILSSELSSKEDSEYTIQEFNSIKANEDVFSLLLSKQPFWGYNKSTSQIIFGSPEANIFITILTNPHCNPCADLHKRIHAFFPKISNKICIQYIFSSFNESLDESNKILIAAFFSNTPEKVREIYKDWYGLGRSSPAAFKLKYGINTASDEVRIEFERHKKWIEKAMLRSTPTIMVNGYKLPESYHIEDLEYITKIDIES